MIQQPEIKEQNEELTFKKLFWLIKKSGVRMFILCVATVLLVALISASVVFATYQDNANAATLVDFNFEGIEEGKDPFGNSFDASKMKSPNVVSQAIASLKADGVEIDPKYQNEIIDNITIEGIIPDDVMQKILVIQSIAEKDVSQLAQLNDITYFPSRYKVTISNLAECGLDKTTAPVLLNAIISSYVEYFKDTYSEDDILAKITPTVNITDYDFIDMYDILFNRIDVMLDYLETKTKAAPTFRSKETSLSFNDILSSVAILRDLDLTIFENNVLNNGITNSPESVVKNLEAKKLQLNNQITSTESLISSLTTTIKEYNNGTTFIPGENGAPGTFITSPSEKYDELFSNLTNMQVELANLKTDLANLENRISKFQTTLTTENTAANEEEINANKALATQQAQAIASKLTGLIETINITTAEYFETQAFNGMVSTAVPAVYQLNLNTSLKIILVVAAVAVLIAAIIAVLWTYHTLVKRNEW